MSNDTKGQYVTKHNNGQNVDNYNDDNAGNREEGKRQKQCRFLWFLLSVIMGVVGIIVFILTEDMTRPMVLVDKWTIVNVLIFIVEIIAITLTFKRKKNNNDNKEENMFNDNTST